MHKKEWITGGMKPGTADKVLIMVHGRGGSPEDIMSVAQYLNVRDVTLIAPRATGNTWYPYSFMAIPSQNEPWLSSALELLKQVTVDQTARGIKKENIYFLGFSQGACLTLEFVTRNAEKYGGVIAFTGGLIGDRIYTENYKGDFSGTPVFIGSSDPDPHVPVERVNASAALLEEMNAVVTKRIYKGMGHTISREEVDEVNGLFFKQ